MTAMAATIGRPAGAAAISPWLVAVGGGDPDLHGGAGHDDRQRRAALHRRRLVGAGHRQRMGHHQLSGGQRDHPADFRLARRRGWAGGIIFCCRSPCSPWRRHCAAWRRASNALIAFRVLQGLAGGGLQPSSQGILLDAFPPEKQGAAMTLFGIAALLAPVVGPTLGGYITDNYGWRWIFYLNVPVGLLALVMCSAVVDRSGLSEGRARPRCASNASDSIRSGLCLLSVTMVCWEIMLSKGQEWDWFGDPFCACRRCWSCSCVCLAGPDLSRAADRQSADQFSDAGGPEFPLLLHHHLLRVRRALRQHDDASRPAAIAVRLRRDDVGTGAFAGRDCLRS